METLAPASTCRHARVRIATARATEFIDLTDQVESLVAASGIDRGLINIQSLHTSASVIVNENEPLLLADFAALLQWTAPVGFSYRHDDESARTVNVAPGERRNGHAHCRALLLGTSVCLNIADGRLQLGRWQRIFFAEFDGPRSREVSVLVAGERRQ